MVAVSGTALVLGAGGVTGVAWSMGLLAGLADAGVDLTGAQLVVGTSAGSVVGAHLTTGASLEQLYAAQLAGPGTEPPARLGARVLLSYAVLAAGTRDPQRFRARIGAMALAARTPSEEQRRAVLAARLPVCGWPQRRFLVTAVDADTGAFTTFDAGSGVDLVDAIGASCAVPGVWPPVSIGGRRYIDGGMRSPANADLADGHDRVVIVAPLVRGAGPITAVAAQAGRLRAAGAAVAVLSPDAAARRAIGRNLLDPARRAAAAAAGRAQAAEHADTVRAVWSG